MSENRATGSQDGAASLSFKIGLLGAFAALLGSLIGAMMTLGPTWWGFQREDATAFRDAEEQAYLDFASRSEQLVFVYRYPALASREPTTLDSLYEARNRVTLYGDQAVRAASNEVVRSIALALEEYEGDRNTDVDDKAWYGYDQALEEYRVAVRAELGIE